MDIKDNKINIWGRYFESENCYVFDNVNSGLEVSFFGTELCITCKTIAHPRINPKYPMFTVLGIQVDKNNPYRFDVKNDELLKLPIASDLKEGFHTIKIFKTDDPLISSFCVNSIETDGYFNGKPTHKYKMAIYGDSILSGGDNLIGDGPSLDVVPGTGDGTKTYASFIARFIDAEVNVLSRCGLCLYPASSFDTEVVVSKIYNKVSTQNLLDWDMNKFVPDIVVIGLGTNDELGNQFTIDGFKESYKDLIKSLAAYNKDTLFVLSYGYMNKDDSVEKAIMMVINELKDSYRVRPLELPKTKRGHPSVREHSAGAKLLLDLLSEEGFA